MGQTTSAVGGELFQDLPYTSLPENVVEEILLNLPGIQVIRVCRLVCHKWRSVADSASFWKKRYSREGLKPLSGIKTSKDWQATYVLHKKRHNLLKNPNAEEEFRGWNILQNGGDRWHIEGVSVAHPDSTVNKCFASSYHLCLKSQLINLVQQGYSPVLLDEIQPDIVISDWYAPRWDCGSMYQICVKLLNQRKSVIQRFEPPIVTFPQWNDQQWNQVTHVFKNYGRGVRFIHFSHGGQDTQFWAGWYGIRVTNSSVEVYPASKT